MQEFRDAVENRDLDALVGLFADDIVFRSPVVHAPYQGCVMVRPLSGLTAIAERMSRQLGLGESAGQGERQPTV